MNQVNISQTILTTARNVLGINHSYFGEGISNKTVIFTNLATVHLLNNNVNGAQEALKNALLIVEKQQPTTNQISPVVPLPLLNLKIYFHLRTGTDILSNIS